MSKTLLFLDDDTTVLESVSELFRTLGVEVTPCSRGEDALALAEQRSFDLVITDLRMPGLNGVDVVRGLLHRHPGLTIYLLTAYSGDALVADALAAGARGVMQKPYEIAKILALLA